MAEYTPNLNLKKPARSENFNISDFNANADILDQKIQDIDQKTDTHQAEEATLSKYGHVKINQGASDVVPACTTADITLYVRTDGSDSNNGSANDAAHALKTIQAAINRIPQIVNHFATINVSAGTYDEALQIYGFVGKGYITITGATELADTHMIKSIAVRYCSCRVDIKGLKATENLWASFFAYACMLIQFYWCKSSIPATGEKYGFNFSNSLGTVLNCEISNTPYALYVVQSIVVSSDWSAGSNNNIGLYSTYGATIAKGGTQPQGTTAEYTTNGGVIR